MRPLATEKIAFEMFSGTPKRDHFRKRLLHEPSYWKHTRRSALQNSRLSQGGGKAVDVECFNISEKRTIRASHHKS
jgi:hypothetical protein